MNEQSNLSNLPTEQIWHELIAAATDQAKLREQNPLAFYEPYKPVGESPQWKFHLSTKPIRILSGGNRSGKTTAGGVEAGWNFTGEYPDWYPEESRIRPQTNRTVIRGRILVTDFEHLGRVVISELDKWLPPSAIRRKRLNPQGFVVRIDGVFVDKQTGKEHRSEIDIMSRKQDPHQAEGWSGHWLWVDEPTERDLWIACTRGLVDTGGREWFTLTPITDPWIFDELYLPAFQGDPDKEVVQAEIFDNPYLSPEYVEQFIKKLPPEDIEARIHGKPKHLQGLIYPEATQDEWWIPPIDIRNYKYTCYHGADIHDRQPGRFVWLAVNPDGDIYVYDAVVLADMTLAEMAQAILQREAQWKKPIRTRFIDPNFGACLNVQTRLTNLQELSKHGLNYVPADNNLPLGHNRVRELLRTGRLAFNQELTVLRHDLSRYAWTEKEKPSEEYKHFPDALRYVLMGHTPYIAPPAPALEGWRASQMAALQRDEMGSFHKHWLNA